MFKAIRKQKAASILEYTFLIMLVLAALLFMGKPIVQAVAGRWRAAGDSFDFGRQYDPRRTQECVFDQKYNFNTWYDLKCFKAGHCSGDSVCEQTRIFNCIRDFPACQQPQI